MKIKLETCEIPSLGITVNEIEMLHLRVLVKRGELEPFTCYGTRNGENVECTITADGGFKGKYPFDGIFNLYTELLI